MSNPVHRAPHDPMERLARTPRDVMVMLESQPLFAGMNARERGPFADIAEVVRCPGHTRVFAAGDDGRFLYIVLQGQLAIRTDDKLGSTANQYEVAPGHAAGCDALLSGKVHDFTCVAVSNTAALRFPLATLQTWIGEGRTGAVKLFAALRTELAGEIRQTADALCSLLEQASARSAPISQTWEISTPRPPSGVHEPSRR